MKATIQRVKKIEESSGKVQVTGIWNGDDPKTYQIIVGGEWYTGHMTIPEILRRYDNPENDLFLMRVTFWNNGDGVDEENIKK